MKKLSLLIISVLITVTLFAQYEKGSVYLKNGTILKGKYKYSNDLRKLNIETAGNIWVFENTEIDSVVPNRIKHTDNIQSKDLQTFFHTEIGLLAGNSNNGKSAPLSFSTSLNYLLSNNFSVGAGIGIEFLNESYLPVFLNAEYKLRSTNSTPYFFVIAGYQVPLEDSPTQYYYDYYYATSSIWPGPSYSENLDPKGGILLNPGLGYMSMFSQDFGISVAFGYRFHRLHYKGDEDYALDIDYNRLSIKLGIIFK